MKVVEILRKAGAKAGLIQVQEEVKEIEIKIVERKIISLAQLQDTTESSEALGAPSPELTVSFENIFQALNLSPPEHGWTAPRVRELLESDEFKGKNPQETAQAILAVLGQNQVKPEDILKDALTRDKALDSYEEFVVKKVHQRGSERKKATDELLNRIHELEKQAAELEKAQKADEKNLQEWLNQKIRQEEELARVASLFVQEHGISISKNKNHTK